MGRTVWGVVGKRVGSGRCTGEVLARGSGFRRCAAELLAKGFELGRWLEELLERGLADMLPKNARVRAVRPGCALDCVVFDASRARERQFRDVDGLAAEVLHTLAFFLAATSRNRCRLSGDVANRRAMSLLANRQPANRSPAQKARPRDPLARKLPPPQPRPRKRPRVREAFQPASISFSIPSRGSSSRLRRRWACSRCWSM